MHSRISQISLNQLPGVLIGQPCSQAMCAQRGYCGVCRKVAGRYIWLQCWSSTEKRLPRQAAMPTLDILKHPKPTLFHVSTGELHGSYSQSGTTEHRKQVSVESVHILVAPSPEALSGCTGRHYGSLVPTYSATALFPS